MTKIDKDNMEILKKVKSIFNDIPLFCCEESRSIFNRSKVVLSKRDLENVQNYLSNLMENKNEFLAEIDQLENKINEQNKQLEEAVDLIASNNQMISILKNQLMKSRDEVNDLYKVYQLEKDKVRSLQQEIEDLTNPQVDEDDELEMTDNLDDYPEKEKIKKTKSQENLMIHSVFENQNTSQNDSPIAKKMRENALKKNFEMIKKDDYYQHSVFVVFHPHSSNIFYHSIEELLILGVDGRTVYQKNFIQNSEKHESYLFDDEREKIYSILFNASCIISYQTSNLIKYLFGNQIAITNIPFLDLKKIYQKQNRIIPVDDVTLAAKNIDPTFAIDDRSLNNKAKAIQTLFNYSVKEYHKFSDFIKDTQLDSLENLLPTWHLDEFMESNK